MPAKLLLLLLLCHAPLRVLAEEGPREAAGRYGAGPTGRGAAAAAPSPPRRFNSGQAKPADRDRSGAGAVDPDVQQAAFVEGDPPPARKKSSLSARNSDRGRSLTPRGDGAAAKQAQAKDRGRPVGTASSVMTGLASLVVVLGLFFAVAWALRRGMPAGAAALPREAVEVLGRTTLAGRQQAHLIRCGNKVLLVYLAQGVAETLTEITDPLEVDRLVGLCQQSHPQSTTASFRQILQQFGRTGKEKHEG
jgi:flagellar biogenesis protein FliO